MLFPCKKKEKKKWKKGKEEKGFHVGECFTELVHWIRIHATDFTANC